MIQIMIETGNSANPLTPTKTESMTIHARKSHLNHDGAHETVFLNADKILCRSRRYADLRYYDAVPAYYEHRINVESVVRQDCVDTTWIPCWKLLPVGVIDFVRNAVSSSV